MVIKNCHYKLFLFFLWSLFSSAPLIAQRLKKDELQNKNKTLRKEIQELNKRFKEKQNEYNATEDQLKELEKKIKTRLELISGISKEKHLVVKSIKEKEQSIQQYEKQLKDLRAEYSEILLKSYKNRDNRNLLLSIVASKNITQAYSRVKYIDLYSKYRARQLERIEVLQEKVKNQVEALGLVRKEKETLIAEQQQEKKKIETEQQQEKQLSEKLKKEQEQILSQVQKKQKEAQQLEAQIKRIIAEEIRLAKIRAEKMRQQRLREEKLRKERLAKETAARKRTEAIARQKALEEKNKRNLASKAKKTEASSTDNRIEDEKTLANESSVEREKTSTSRENRPKTETHKEKDYTEFDDTDIKRSSNFATNKGHLPWPVPRGRLISKFGRQAYPGLKSVYVENSGVEIAAPAGAKAHAVFDGVVAAVYSVPGGNQAILIQHGKYYTVYHNLAKVHVSKGQNVNSQQPIGTIYTDQNKGEAILNFQVWNGFNKENPSLWLR